MSDSGWAQDWAGMRRKGGRRAFAPLDLSTGLDALCRCHANKSLAATLKVYSTVNMHVHTNVCRTPRGA